MALTEAQLSELKKIFEESFRPVILFDDDADGLSSFLLIYRHIREGKGIPVKNAPELGPDLAEKVNNYDPDIVFIVDVPIVSQEFINKIKTRIVWIDHHPVVNRKGVEYYNPRVSDSEDNRPTSYWIYKTVKENIWIAMFGIVGDWFLPEKEILDEFISKYPTLLSPEINRPEVALHNSGIGELVQIISFNLKGKIADVLKSVKIMTRIKEPDEIIHQLNPGGRFIFKKYERLKSKYDELKKQIKVDPDDKLLLFTYTNPESFSAELSNELVYLHPEKVIIVVWEYGGEYKCSLRSTKVNLPALIEKSLDGVNGYGGGHDHAAGACIKTADFDRFVENMRKHL